jgi:hypothetical protein
MLPLNKYDEVSYMYYFPFHLISANEVGVLPGLVIVSGLPYAEKGLILYNTKKAELRRIWPTHVLTARH